MKLSQFKFKLPEERIAQYPTPFRDDCRLMVVHAKSGVIEHRESFRDILQFFDDKDVFVFNDTKVFPARLYGNKEKTGAKIEVFLLRELNKEMRLWDVLVDPARKIRIGNKLYFGEDESMVAEVIDNTTSRGRTLRFLYDGPHDEFKRNLFALGEAPIPKEIVRRESELDDLENFQCIFAKNEGAVTAPTAGLHFSPQLMKMMEIKGIEFAYITMHCGLGNFREIDVEDLTKHKMDSEEMHVEAKACEIINKAKEDGRKVVAVGTTVQRTLETAVSSDGRIKEYDGWTNKFIFPPYDFTLADAMVANFYLPYSTLLMLTCAYGGYDLIMKAYKEALRFNENDPEKRYRFGTYGDAMLILQD
jgi:S-adenosylmethionine:tRNA ribosyltransferase-isomerase